MWQYAFTYHRRAGLSLRPARSFAPHWLRLLGLHVLDDELSQLIWLVAKWPHAAFKDNPALWIDKVCLNSFIVKFLGFPQFIRN